MIVGGRCFGGINYWASGDNLEGDVKSLSGVALNTDAAMLGYGLKVAGGEW